MYIALIFLFVAIPQPGEFSFMSAFIFALMCLFQHFVSEGVLLLLLEKGMGWHSARQCSKKAALWALFTFFIRFFQYYLKDSMLGFSLYMGWNMIILLFYAGAWLAPKHRLFRRPAAYNYAKFWFFYRLFAILAIVFQFIPILSAAGNCMYAFGSVMFFALFEPAVTYYTLLADCSWWQGTGLYTGSKSRSSRRLSRKKSNLDIDAPLAGTDLSVDSAHKLATTMDQLGGEGVSLLNFAYIKMNTRRVLGQGSFSKVYQGTYRLKPVALKLIYTVDLTVEIITRVAAEAELLSSFHSPNIVKIYGVSVLPPSVVILLELCKYGSLGDVLRGKEVYIAEHNDVFVQGKMRLSIMEHLYMAIGCSRGIAALHQHENVCHRDIKSFNFLIDRSLEVKLADLELGVSKSAVNNFLRLREPGTGNIGMFFCCPSTDSVALANNGLAAYDVNDGAHSPGPESADSTCSTDGTAPRSERILSSDMAPLEDAAGFLANWAAPEFISDEQYTQASDIYSLGLVLWEIVSKQLPFDELTNNQRHLRKQIVRGLRPRIPEGTPEWLCDLISSMWQTDPQARPSAKGKNYTTLCLLRLFVLLFCLLVYVYMYIRVYLLLITDVVKTLEWHYFSCCYDALTTIADPENGSTVWSTVVPTESPVPHSQSTFPPATSKGTGHDVADQRSALPIPSLHPKIPLVASVSDDSLWHRLNSDYVVPQFVSCSGVPMWAVFSTSTPFYCLNATNSFIAEFGLVPLAQTPATASNDSAHLLSLVRDLSSDATNSASMSSASSSEEEHEGEREALKGLEQAIASRKFHHSVCRLGPPDRRNGRNNNNHASSFSGVTAKESGLYSIHCFPLNTLACPELPSSSTGFVSMSSLLDANSNFKGTTNPMFSARSLPISAPPSPGPGNSATGVSGLSPANKSTVSSQKPIAVVMVSFSPVVQPITPRDLISAHDVENGQSRSSQVQGQGQGQVEVELAAVSSPFDESVLH